MEKNKITQRIIETRKIKKKTTGDLAEKLNISESTYRKREAEETPWKIEDIQEIARILKVTEAYLFCGIKGTIYSNENISILELINKLSPETKKALLKFLQEVVQN